MDVKVTEQAKTENDKNATLEELIEKGKKGAWGICHRRAEKAVPRGCLRS